MTQFKNLSWMICYISVFCDSKLNIFGVWSAGWNKQAKWPRHLGLQNDICHYILTIYRTNDYSIYQEIYLAD